jgi:glycosyltransferase involved in cell wall biosynthesis
MTHGLSNASTKRLVSVIVPCYNRKTLIARSLDSVLAQSYRPIELIVVDDGSTDNTVERVKAWLASLDDPYFTATLIRKENRGPASARNAGLAVCTGEFVQYLDSDDLLAPDKIAAQVDALVKNGAEFAWSPMSVETLSGRVEAPQVWFARHDQFPDSACVGLYRRSLIVRIGPWREDLYAKEDYDYRYRAELARPKKVFVPGIKYQAFEHELGRENDKFGTVRDIEAVLQILDSARVADVSDELSFSLSARYRNCLDWAISKGDRLLARKACAGLIATATDRYERIRARCVGWTLRLGGPVAVQRAQRLIRALGERQSLGRFSFARKLQ